MWKPLVVAAAMGSVTLHVMVLSSYSDGEGDNSSPPPVVQKAALGKDRAQTIVFGSLSKAIKGPNVKVAEGTFIRFPEGTRVVTQNENQNLLVVDLEIPLAVDEVISEFKQSMRKTPYGARMEQETQKQAVKLKFWSGNGTGYVLLDKVAQKTTLASIRIYGGETQPSH